MKGHLKTTIACVVLAGTTAAASAITFTNVSISGSNGTWSLLSTNDGLRFVIPGANLYAAGSKTVTLSYDVTATTGNVLSGYTIFPNGTVKNGTVDIDLKHTRNSFTQADDYLTTAGSTITAIPSETATFTKRMGIFHAVETINLTDRSGVAKVTNFTIQYAETVPEPASILALAAGIGIAASRRLRRRSK